MDGPESLRIMLLGGFDVRVGDRIVEAGAWTRRKARALVALLALAPGGRLHREQVMDHLWPELDPRAAANNLRKVLHVARRTLDPDPRVGVRLIAGKGDTLALPRNAWVDVRAFEDAAVVARRSRDADRYATALALYRGDLLPEDRYEEWVLTRHDELRAEFLELLSEHAGLLEARGDLDAAAGALRRLLASDPLDEDRHVHLMRVYALAGRRRDALEQYERLREVLERELESEPGVEAQRLREEVAAGRSSEPALTADLWERVGDLRLLSGDAGGAAGAFEAALELRDSPGATPLRVRLHRKAARARLVGHDPDGAEPHLVAAERLALEDSADRARLTTLRANLCWERGDIATAVDAARRAIELAEAHGEPEDIAAAHEALAIVDHFRGDWREGLVEEVDRLGKLPDQQAQLAGVFDIHHCIGQYHLYGDGLWQSVEGYARRTLELAERAGAVRAQAFAWCLLGESLLLRARWDEAAGCLQTSGELHASLGTRSGGLPWQRLAEAAVCRGDPNDAGPFLTKAAGIATVSSMAPHLWGRIHSTTALAALETGNHMGAVRSIRAASGTAARYGECLSCSALLHPVAAEVYAALDDVEAIRPHLAAADRIAGLSSSSAWRAMASSARASLQEADGRRVDAAHTYLLASDLFEQAGQPYWAARAAGHSRRVA